MNPLDRPLDKSYRSSQRTVSQSSSSDKSSVTKSSVASQKPATSELVSGDKIKGVVTDIVQREVKLTLNDSTILTGRLNDAISLSIGQSAEFEVIQSTQNQLLLRFLPEGKAQAQSGLISKALDAANLPNNERNQTIVKELLNNQLSIDNNSIHKLLQQSLAFKNTSIATLAIMSKYNVPVNPETTSQFEAYRNYEHRILGHLTNTTSQLIEIIAQPNLPQAAGAHQNLLSMLTSIPVSENSSLLNNDLTSSGASSKSALTNNSLANITAASDLVTSASENPPFVTLNHNTEVIPGFESSHESAASFPSAETSGLSPEQQLVNPQESGALLSQDNITATLSKPDTPLASLLPQEGLQSFFTAIENIEYFSRTFSPETLAAIKDGSINIQDFLTQLAGSAAASSESNAAFSALANDPAYQNFLQKVLQHRWTLSPEELTKENALDEYYSRLTSDIKHTEQFLSSSATLNDAANALRTSVENLKDMLDFQTLLNQLFPYVQLPIRFSDKTTHSELYVYTKKEALHKNPHDISVLLHLDMEQLGPLDVYLDLKGNSINSRFYLDDSSSAALIDQSLPELAVSLEAIGYSFKSEIILREESSDPVSDFIALEHTEGSVKRYSFDMRA